jgi:hypothetical protein
MPGAARPIPGSPMRAAVADKNDRMTVGAVPVIDPILEDRLFAQVISVDQLSSVCWRPDIEPAKPFTRARVFLKHETMRRSLACKTHAAKRN